MQLMLVLLLVLVDMQMLALITVLWWAIKWSTCLSSVQMLMALPARLMLQWMVQLLHQADEVHFGCGRSRSLHESAILQSTRFLGLMHCTSANVYVLGLYVICV
jgi:hypothetical protein